MLHLYPTLRSFLNEPTASSSCQSANSCPPDWVVLNSLPYPAGRPHLHLLLWWQIQHLLINAMDMRWGHMWTVSIIAAAIRARLSGTKCTFHFQWRCLLSCTLATRCISSRCSNIIYILFKDPSRRASRQENELELTPYGPGQSTIEVLVRHTYGDKQRSGKANQYNPLDGANVVILYFSDLTQHTRSLLALFLKIYFCLFGC